MHRVPGGHQKHPTKGMGMVAGELPAGYLVSPRYCLPTHHLPAAPGRTQMRPGAQSSRPASNRTCKETGARWEGQEEDVVG
jgi:hypothetical protein